MIDGMFTRTGEWTNQFELPDGYRAGYEEGYDKGYDKGFEEGYDKGYNSYRRDRHRAPGHYYDADRHYE